MVVHAVCGGDCHGGGDDRVEPGGEVGTGNWQLATGNWQLTASDSEKTMRNPFGHDDAQADSELIAVIRQVRRRWRLKLALRGAAIVAALTVVVFLAAALGLESSRFAPGAIVAFRVVLPVAMLVLVGLFFVRP